MLTGLQSGFISQYLPQLSSSSGLLPSCPPYWMMFSSPQQSRLASHQCSDFWEPNSRQCSNSLNPTILCTRSVISNSEGVGESATEKAETFFLVKAYSGEECHAVSCQLGQRKAQKAFIPDLVNPPSCLSSLPHQRRKNLRQRSLSMLNTSKQHSPHMDSQSKSPSSHRIPDTRAPNIRANTIDRFPNINTSNITRSVST